MKNPAKVTVLMSVLGYEAFVRQSIRSILDQTFSDFIFIIIDDGCRYDLSGIIKNFNDSRIIFLKNPKNIGLTGSLINGIKLSSSEYIARQDAGNISLPQRIEKQYHYLENNPKCYLIGSSVVIIDELGNEICQDIVPADFELLKKKISENNCIYHSSVMFKNDRKYIYREKFKYSQDYDLYLRLLTDRIFFNNIPDSLLKERLLPYSITFAKNSEQKFYKNLALKFYKERLEKGKDSYQDFTNLFLESRPDQLNERFEVEKAEKEKKINMYFYRQKAYCLFYSFKFPRLRTFYISLKEKNEFDIKLLSYYVLSFLPFLVKMIKKIKRIRIR